MTADKGNPAPQQPVRQRLTRAEAKARTREQLLDAAAQVFAQRGYAGASVDEIAEAAGYSAGALYSNFNGKEQLFLELMSERRSQGIARQAAQAADSLGLSRPDAPARAGVCLRGVRRGRRHGGADLSPGPRPVQLRGAVLRA